MPLPNKPGIPNQRPQQGQTGRPINPQQQGNRPNLRSAESANRGTVSPQQQRDLERIGQNSSNPMFEPDYDEDLRARSNGAVNPDSAQAQLRERLRQAGRRPDGGRIVNEYDEEDAFEQLSVDEQLDYDRQEEEEQKRRAAKRQAAERRAQQQADKIRAEKQAELEREIQKRTQAIESFNEDEDDDIVFEDSEADDETNEYVEDFASEEAEEEIEDNPAPKKKASKKHSKKSSKKDMFEDNTKDAYGQDVFIDEENGKLLPFGSKKGKKQKTKEHDYDNRKNLRTSANIVRGIIIVGLVGMLALGTKNTLFPAPPLTEDEVVATIQSTVNITDFPVDRGEGFAKDFVQAYLSTDAEGQDVNSSVLSYFYTGAIDSGVSAESTRQIDPNYKQSIVYGPTVYEAVALTDYSARYTIGAVIKPAESADGETGEAVQTSPQWVFLNVNVYYDANTDRFTITPDSPSVVPNSSVGAVDELPEQQALGEENTDTAFAEQIAPVIYGFLNGYRVSTPDDRTTLEQYIVANPPSSLVQGLGGEYEFAGGGVENATEYIIYTVPEDPDTLKVQVRVTWATGTNEDSKIQMTSTYVATLEKQPNDMYLVSRFQPLYFVQDEVSAAQNVEESSETAE